MELFSFVHNRDHWDKEKKNYIEMLFSKDSQRPPWFNENILQDSQIERKAALF
jgi:hypothetical protein